MGILARFIGWLWRRWADYNSVVALLDLLDWKTGITALIGGVAMAIIGATNQHWSPQGVILAGLAAAACVAVIAIVIRAWLEAKNQHRSQTTAADPKTVIVENRNVVASGPSSTAQQIINYIASAPAAYSGILFSAIAVTPQAMIQFGPRGPTFGAKNSDYPWGGGSSGSLLPYLRESHLIVEMISGKIMVSTEILDKSGMRVATLTRNEWQTAVPPTIWDRNYTETALEVVNADGHVVLQIRILTDRIQILGEWWDREGRGIRIAGNSNEVAMVILSAKINPPNPKIEPMFKYPSDRHHGELSAPQSQSPWQTTLRLPP